MGQYQVTLEGFKHVYIDEDEVESEEEAQEVAQDRAMSIPVNKTRMEGPYR